MDDAPTGVKPGHGDHWLAALEPGDPRLMEALALPKDTPKAVTLHRRALTPALDLVQVSAGARLLTAYPEPRATALVRLRPRELALWETPVEGWLVAEHEGAGVLTLFLTDLVERASVYEKAKREITLELGGLAYTCHRAMGPAIPSRLRPARAKDERFLPDDYWFDADVAAVHVTKEGFVLDLVFQNGLAFPVATRQDPLVGAGDRVQGFLWLTGRLPQAP